MQVGVCLPNYRALASPEAIARAAGLAEELGFDSVWVTDHVVIPTPYLSRFGPVFYDPVATLAYVAGLTRRVRLGTTVLILSYRNPIVLAKALATVDQLSGGRLIFGAAAGWAELEFRALGVPFEERGPRSDEYLALIKALWTQERPSFQGRFFSFSDLHFLPRPVQRPHPPIWIGGRSRRALRRAVEHGDAWHPTFTPPAQLQQEYQALREMAAQRGRATPPALTMRLGVRLGREAVRGDGRQPGTGSAAQVAEDLRRYAEVGVEHLVLDFPTEEAPELFRAMEVVARAVLPRVRQAP